MKFNPWLVVKPLDQTRTYMVLRVTFYGAGFISGLETDETRCAIQRHSIHESLVHDWHDDFIDAWKQAEDMRRWYATTRRSSSGRSSSTDER